MPYELHVNGRDHLVDVDGDTPLLWVLRDTLNLKGAKFSCGEGMCGACIVHIDGRPVHTCRLKVSAAAGSRITTIEGIGSTELGARLQKAWLEVDVLQCGYCQPGQIMSAAALLQRNPSPSDDEITAAMDGNICRCGTYLRIREAIKRAVRGTSGRET
ncbi:MAG: (2Fe-2S)-binding protein [Alphaproteobacteria bacterium]|nr:(2Fe-2S)-binding protein [Alphaproteobacteria bacterium]